MSLLNATLSIIMFEGQRIVKAAQCNFWQWESMENRKPHNCNILAEKAF